MGVPGLFLWLVKKYGNDNLIINKESINDIDSLFIDTNCLLHPQCFKVLENFIGSNEDLEKKMIDECINYIDYLINYIQPKHLVYLAIDGTAPFAKIKQQKLRRFKSAKDNRLYNNLKKKYNKPLGIQWSNSCITPGTVFMENLHNKINDYVKNKEKCGFYKIIYSSCYSPSEGEHKILQYIRNNNLKFNNYIIYGLDADLIFLSLASQKKNIYLLRESNIVKKESKYKLSLVSVNYIIDYLIEEFKFNIINKKNIVKNKIIIDFIFICFFLGNDFLPNIPSIDIGQDRKLINGIDILIYCYCKTFNIYNNYIINLEDTNLTFNEEILINIIDNIILFENKYFTLKYENKNKKYCKSSDLYEKELFKIDNLQFKIIDNIKLGKDNDEKWKTRYYKENFNIKFNYDLIICDICKCYIDGLVWNILYYLNKCPSWSWYYKYNHAPFISDLRKYIKSFNLNDIKFKLDKPLKPLQQLFCVLPPQYSNLLPKSYKYLVLNDKSPLIYLFPRDFEMDMIGKNKYWQCNPKIPMINYEQIKITEKFKLTESEKKRNIIIYN